MGTEWLVSVLVAILLFREGESLYCHRCISTMGGCGQDGVNLLMFGWKNCGPSERCVKVIHKIPGQYEPIIIRECEHILMRSTRYRLEMPNIRRHNYCMKGRSNNKWDPLNLFSESLEFCFCNEYPGCNSADAIKMKLIPAILFSSLVSLLVSKLF